MKIKTQRKGWLVILLNDVDWHWCSQLPGQEMMQGDAAQAMPAAAAVDTFLLLPGEQVTLASLNAKHANAEALRWQFEPLLSSEIETLHIAALQRDGDHHVLAAIDAEGLREALNRVAALGYQPQRVLPDAFAMPLGSRVRIGNRWLLRLNDGSALVLPDHALAHFPALIALEHLHQDPLPLLAQGVRISNSNLLQGSFLPTAPLRKPLIALACAAGFMLISLLFPPLWQGWQAQRAVAEINAQVLQRYQHYFPHETPAQPYRAFTRKAMQLEQPDDHPALLSLLRNAASTLGKLHENPLQTLHWDSATQQLRLEFRDELPATAIQPLPVQVRGEINQQHLTLSSRK